jgi:hypothetical protein
MNSGSRLASEEKPPQQSATLSLLPVIYAASSVLTGIITTGIFNPIDRALYLAVVEKRSFLNAANFQAPYQGCFQAMLQKCIFGSLYYISQDALKTTLHPYLVNQLKTPEVFANLSLGLLAGSLNGILSNPMSAVKYTTWGDDNRKYLPTAKEMWKTNRFKPFIRGTRATVYREMAFGSVYEIFRNQLRSQFIAPETAQTTHTSGVLTIGFACNTLSAVFATVAASPFNYARNMQYKVPLQTTAPTVKTILSTAYKEASKERKTVIGKANFFATKFQIGWGTARAGVGMAVGQILFDETKRALTKQLKPKR